MNSPLDEETLVWYTLVALLVFVLLVARLIQANKSSEGFFPQKSLSQFADKILLWFPLASRSALSRKFYFHDLLKYKRYLLLISFTLYLSSLFLPAFIFDAGMKPVLGHQILYIGAWGILVLEPRWYANVFYWFCLVVLLRNNTKTANKATTLAAVLAISSFIFPICYFPDAAGCSPVKHLGSGAYLWLIAIIVTTWINVLQASDARRSFVGID